MSGGYIVPYSSIFVNAMLLQLPFEITPFPAWSEAIEVILNLLYVLTARGYLLLILLGFMIYVSGVGDGFAKTLVIAGIALFAVGPYLLNIFADLAGIGTFNLEHATMIWYSTFGLADSDLFGILITIGDIEVAVCILTGAILYFTPTSNDLNSRGYSLIVRGIIFLPILTFLHIAPWL